MRVFTDRQTVIARTSQTDRCVLYMRVHVSLCFAFLRFCVFALLCFVSFKLRIILASDPWFPPESWWNDYRLLSAGRAQLSKRYTSRSVFRNGWSPLPRKKEWVAFRAGCRSLFSVACLDVSSFLLSTNRRRACVRVCSPLTIQHRRIFLYFPFPFVSQPPAQASSGV